MRRACSYGLSLGTQTPVCTFSFSFQLLGNVRYELFLSHLSESTPHGRESQLKKKNDDESVIKRRKRRIKTAVMGTQSTFDDESS
jgi:hypothetical protein